MADKRIVPRLQLRPKISDKLIPTVAVGCHFKKKEPLLEYLRRSKSARS